MTLKSYLIVSLVAISVCSGVAIKRLYDRNQELKTEVSQLETQAQHAQDNLVLVQGLLVQEQKLRAVAETARIHLKEVPDADFNKKLPDSIVDVLDAFHSGVQ